MARPQKWKLERENPEYRKPRASIAPDGAGEEALIKGSDHFSHMLILRIAVRGAPVKPAATT
jgi:hypothetical protein